MNFDFSILDILTPLITGIAGWLAGARKRRNDFLHEMQQSIDLLSSENKELLAEMIELRKENAFLQANQDKMQIEISMLRAENGQLRIEVEELNNRLANIKTITRKV